MRLPVLGLNGPFDALLLFLLGLAVATPASMIGLAGGVAILPALILGFRLEPRFAIGTTVVAVFLAIASASVAFIRSGRVDYKLALLFDALDIAGVALGAYLTVVLLPDILALALSAFLIYSGLRGLKKVFGKALGGRDRPAEPLREDKGAAWRIRHVDRSGRGYTYELGLRELAIAVGGSFFSGLVSGLLGLGGGLVDLSLMLLIGIPFEVASATAMFGMLITRTSSVVAHVVLGNVRPEIAIPLSIGAFLGGQLGPRLSGRVSPRALRAGFSLVALSFGVILLVRACSNLMALLG